MKATFNLGQWLGVFTVGAGLALSVARSASASTIPSEEVTIVVSNAATGNVIAGGTFDSGIHTGPPGTTPPFSANSTQILTGFTGAGGLGGITMSSGQYTADNNYSSTATSTGLGQYLESIVNNLTNTNSSATNVTLIVSAKNFVAGNGTVDNADSLNLSGSYTGAAGSSITANWYEDNANGLSSATGTAGSAPVVTIHGSQVGGTFSFIAPDNGADAFSNFQSNLLVNFTSPFSMTLVETLHLTSGAVQSNTSQAQLAQNVLPLPGTFNAGLALMGVLLAGEGSRRLRKARPA